MLRAVASVCQQALREMDVMGRYGGEEFIVVLPETYAAKQAGRNCVRVYQKEDQLP